MKEIADELYNKLPAILDKLQETGKDVEGRPVRIHLRNLSVIALAILVTTSPIFSASAETSLEETKMLLQKGLTLHEIDQEIARLTEQEQQMREQIDENKKTILKQEANVERSKKRAAYVLRASYTGERNSLWMLMFSAENFSDALAIFEYLTMIVQSDQRSLNLYKKNVEELNQANVQLVNKEAELGAVKEAFLAERDRSIALQKELEEQLKNRSDAAALQAQIDSLSMEWEAKGLPLFTQYLQAMSDAMQDLSLFIAEHKESLQIDGLNYTMRIKDQDLNDFLQGRIPLFNDFVYRFTEKQITIGGTKDGIKMYLAGHFQLEDEPENAIHFIIDELQFNSFSLPDTRIKSLQDQFKLRFSPSNVITLLEATDVGMIDKVLTIQLRIRIDN